MEGSNSIGSNQTLSLVTKRTEGTKGTKGAHSYIGHKETVGKRGVKGTKTNYMRCKKYLKYLREKTYDSLLDLPPSYPPPIHT